MKTTTKESAEDFLMSQLEVSETKEDLILQFWFYWVESVTTNLEEYQKVIACSPVSKWFIIELGKEEIEFQQIINRYPQTEGKDKDWLYCKCISKLMSRFPKPLLEAAKKREQKKQSTRVLGICIQSSIVKLN